MKYKFIREQITQALLILFCTNGIAQNVMVYPAPVGAPTSSQYTVKASNLTVPVYQGVATGGDTYFFCYFDFDSGNVSIEITSQGINLSSPKIRPTSSNISPSLSNGKVSFSIFQHGHYALMPSSNGYSNVLFIYANPKEVNPPKNGDPNVVYFGPGIHQVNNLNIASNQTLYIHGSAFLKGGLNLTNKSNIKIIGRGIIDGMDWAKWTGPTGYKYALIKLENTTNVTIDGIVIRGSWAASIHVYTSTGTVINNVKVCNNRFANDDGIAPINTKNVTIKNTFIRTDDDNIPIKGYDNARIDCDNILVENCVFWCDRARIILLGAETLVKNMKNITIRNCEVIHYEARFIWAQSSEEGTIGPNVLIENINLQSDNDPSASYKELIRITSEIVSWAQYDTPGYVDGITIRNLNVTGVHNGERFIWVEGYDTKYTAKNVTIECLKYNGVVINKSSNGVYVGDYTSNINIKNCSGLTSLQDESSSNIFTLYPNPANEELYIANAPIGAAINICDMNSRVLISEKIVSENQSINISSLAQGMYLAKVGEVVKKINVM